MEYLILIALVGAAAWFASRLRSDRRRDTKKRPEQAVAERRFQPKTEPKTFDSSTAKPKTARPIISGPARVIDGDSIVIKKTQIRLFGVDAPEIDHPYGKKAKWALVALCKGRKVNAEVLEEDAHGRTVAKCTLDDGTDLSAEMVKQGLAIDWPKFSGGVYRRLETPDARKKLWLADARQKGRMHVWAKYEAQQKARQPTRRR